MRQRHYFDHAASSPVNDVCREAFAAYDAGEWAGANPNSLHTSGRRAFEALEGARRDFARSIGARRPSEVVFTSGGTESNNLAVRGMASAALRKSRGKRSRVLVFSLEHDSVLEPAFALAKDGRFEVQSIPSTPQGFLDLEKFGGLLGDDVALVAVMAANNEVGTVQPLTEAVALAHGCGALVHTDAIQSFGHVDFDVSRLDVDSASFAAHKIAGPVGVGALYVKARTPIDPQVIGGGQEGGLRSGTVDVRGALAMAAVAHDAVRNLAGRASQVAGLADELQGLLLQKVPNAKATVAGARGEDLLPGVVHMLFPGHQTEGLILALDELGYEVSGGSACASASLEPSHVLSAMGVPRDEAFCALRISFDHRTGREEVLGLAEAIGEVCNKPGASRRRGR